MEKSIERYIEKVIPSLNFTPEGRRLEYELAKKSQELIEEMKIPEEEKEYIKNMWWDYIFEYERLYARYNREKAIAIDKALSILN